MNTILLVEDDPGRETSLIRYLELSGYTMLIAETPEETVQTIEENRRVIKLVILDIMMPPGDMYTIDETHKGLLTGALLLEKIREMLPDVPVIVMTALPSQRGRGKDLESRLTKEGIIYMAKPVLPSILLQKIKEVLI